MKKRTAAAQHGDTRGRERDNNLKKMGKNTREGSMSVKRVPTDFIIHPAAVEMFDWKGNLLEIM